MSRFRHVLAGLVAAHMALVGFEAAAAPADCRLPKAQHRAKLPGGETVSIVALAEQQMLGLLAAEKIGATGKSGYSMKMLPLLPNGGIRGEHICDKTLVLGSDLADVVVALQLAPSLDIKKSYPAAFKAASRRDQLIFLPAGSYAVFSVPKGGDARKVLADHWDDKVMSRDVPAFEIGGRLYVHLRIKPVS